MLIRVELTECLVIALQTLVFGKTSSVPMNSKPPMKTSTESSTHDMLFVDDTLPSVYREMNRSNDTKLIVNSTLTASLFNASTFSSSPASTSNLTSALTILTSQPATSPNLFSSTISSVYESKSSLLHSSSSSLFIPSSTLATSIPTNVYSSKQNTNSPTYTTHVNGQIDLIKSCTSLSPELKYFGQYGVIGISITGGIAALCLFALAMVLCWPQWRIRRRRLRKAKEERMNGGSSELRAISGLYRPRPSLMRSTQCVPTPLAMVSDELTSITSQRANSIDKPEDEDDESNQQEITKDEPGHLPTISTADRKGSQMYFLIATIDKRANDYLLMAVFFQLDRRVYHHRKQAKSRKSRSRADSRDPSNVSTFLLRQTSLKLEEDRRNASLASQL